jgi:hypothetical protein
MIHSINLNNNDVIYHELTVDAIRNDHVDSFAEVVQWLDEAQGSVFSNEHTAMYLVIKVTK